MQYGFLEEESFIVLNRLLWSKAIDILHWFFIEPIRKDQLKDLEFDSIEVILSICEPELLCVLAL